MEHFVSKLLIIFLIITELFFQAGCTKTEYIIEEHENADTTSVPGAFSVTVLSRTDTEVQIRWDIPYDNDNDLQSFEVGVNDSIIVYDLSKTINTYKVQNLTPDTEYQLSVVAVDHSLKSSVAKTSAKTYPSFVKAILRLDLEYEDFRFHEGIATSDGGFLIEGRGTINIYTSPSHDFIIKLKSDYSIEWKKEYDEWYSSSTYSLRSIIECADGGYLLTHSHALTKLTAFGEIQWTTVAPGDLNTGYLSSSSYDSSGNFITVGCTSRNLPNRPVTDEYFVIKLSSAGEILWYKYGGSDYSTYAEGIFILDDSSILVCGTSRQNFWTMLMNDKGDEQVSKVYPNSYGVEDILYSSYLDGHKNLILLGAYAGALPPYGYSNTFPRALKVDLNGNIIWDIYPRLTDYYVFSAFSIYAATSNEDLLVIGTDDRGISLNLLSSGGNVSEIKTFRNYPSMLILKDNPEGYYEMVSSDGYIIVLDKEGYLDIN